MNSPHFHSHIADLVASALLGEQYHLASHGHRANGFKITIGALEAVRVAVVTRHGSEPVVDPVALEWWAASQPAQPTHPLHKPVADLQSMATPYAAHVWKLLVTQIYIESR
jgi:hypothetical protein